MQTHLRFTHTAAFALVLTGIAGYVDAIGYLRLAHIYTANMSGNSVSLGIHLATSNWPGVWSRAEPILFFVIGLLISRLVINAGARGSWKSPLAAAFALELAGLAGFAASSGNVAVAAASFAMGIQAAAISHFGNVTLYTCFVTGTLVKMASHMASVLEALFTSARPLDPKELKQMLWFGGAWIGYLVGAILGALALAGIRHLAIPIACVVLAGIIASETALPTKADEQQD